MCLAEARHDFVDAFDAGSGKQFGGAGALIGVGGSLMAIRRFLQG